MLLSFGVFSFGGGRVEKRALQPLLRLQMTTHWFTTSLQPHRTLRAEIAQLTQPRGTEDEKCLPWFKTASLGDSLAHSTGSLTSTSSQEAMEVPGELRRFWWPAVSSEHWLQVRMRSSCRLPASLPGLTDALGTDCLATRGLLGFL